MCAKLKGRDSCQVKLINVDSWRISILFKFRYVFLCSELEIILTRSQDRPCSSRKNHSSYAWLALIMSVYSRIYAELFSVLQCLSGSSCHATSAAVTCPIPMSPPCHSGASAQQTSHEGVDPDLHVVSLSPSLPPSPICPSVSSFSEIECINQGYSIKYCWLSIATLNGTKLVKSKRSRTCTCT